MLDVARQTYSTVIEDIFEYTEQVSMIMGEFSFSFSA